MEQITREQFKKFSADQARLNGVSSISESYSVSPAIQQKLEQKIQESSAFLKRINMLPVVAQKGQKVGVGISGTIASRTDTSQSERVTTDMTDLIGNLYECVPTDFDTRISWNTLDAWALQGNFQRLVRQSVIQREALDRIMIGWNGTSAALQSDRSKNGLLQDLNVGWLQQVRNNAPERVLSNVTVGGSTGYKTLDALIYDATNELIDPWFRDDPTLVVIVGRGLMADKYFPLINNYEEPRDRVAVDLIMSQKRMGGLPAVQVPFMPDGTALITSLNNLSLYYQKGARRSFVIDNPRRSAVEYFDSSNDAYVIEQYGKACLIEGITLKGDQASGSSSLAQQGIAATQAEDGDTSTPAASGTTGATPGNTNGTDTSGNTGGK
ncbi:hypothetical protein LMG33818_002632 [Halomonadaceae bacterium LMG 33818]|uniref:phage major capsid protein, P2 family n=1 Tax=Cernens ardua TaxID=3402176 RepID=UPI003EDC6452